MSGANNFNYRGIIPRSISTLFEEIGKKPDYDIEVNISYLEIYNETVFDLLSPTPTFEQRGDITFQEDARGNVTVKGLSKHPVSNEEEAFNLLFEGESNRTISEHQLNKESTRSHCVFTITLEMKSKVESSEKVITSKLNFVDLAGSERVKKTGSTGLALKEATYINKSLTFLEQVVVALTDKKKKEYVPYRQSKLTHILKDSIGGNCKTVMIANIWPEEPYINETLSTLNFAKRMKNVVNEISVNVRLDSQALVKKLTKEIKELKQELAMHNTLSTGRQINYDPYSAEEQYEQQKIAMAFLSGTQEDMEFESVRQAKELFNQIRIIFQKKCIRKEISEEEKVQQMERQKSLKEGPQEVNDKNELVGEVEEKPSFGIGRAPKGARPDITYDQSGGPALGQSMNIPEEDEEKEEMNIKDEDIFDEIPRGTIPDKNTAFNIFKKSREAKKIQDQIKQENTNIKEKRAQAMKAHDDAEIIKQEYSKKSDEEGSIPPEKFMEKEKVKEEKVKLKKEYNNKVTEFTKCADEIKNSKVKIDQLKIEYVEVFENWFFKKFNITLEEHELQLAKTKFGVNEGDERTRGRNLGSEEIAYINAKRKVQIIHNAKRMEKKIK
ncbi:MAG: hypothetical protein MJ252_05435 [archaeon]|nr:hypothetical protein [archaeon]